MWEHRSVSDKSFQETGRILPNETYVKLMDEVEAVVTRAQDDKFDAETFMTYIPRKGPWEEIPASDHSKACLLYTSPSPRDYAASRMPSSA